MVALTNFNKKLSSKPFFTLILYIIGEVLSRAAPFLLIPYFSRQLDPEGFGQLSLYYSYVVLFSALFSLSLDTACAQYFYKKGMKRVGVILTISNLYYILLLLISLLLLYLSENPFFLALSVSSLSSLYMLHLVQLQAKRYVLSYLSVQFIYTTLFSISALIGVYFFKSYLAVALAQCLSYMLLVPFLAKNNIRFVKKKFTIKYAFFLFSFGFPLILHKSSAYLRDGFERLLVSEYFSEFDLGIYFAAKQLGLILLVLITVANRAIVPHVMESLSKGKFSKKLFDLVMISSFILAFLVWYILELIPGGSFMVFVFGKPYLLAYAFVPQLICGALLYLPYSLAVNIMYFNREVKSIATITFLTSIIHVVWVCYFAYKKDLMLLSYASIISNLIISCLIYRKASTLLEVKNDN